MDTHEFLDSAKMLEMLDAIQIYGGISYADSCSDNRNCTYLNVCTSK